MKKLVFVLICHFLFFSLTGIAKEVEYSVGIARDSSDKVMYIEKHTSLFSDKDLKILRTDYYDPQKKEFGFFETDYSKNPYVPGYEFRDKRNNRFVKVQVKKNEVHTVFKTGKDQKKESKNYQLLENMVAGQGLHNFLRKNIRRFIEDEKYKDSVKFLIPMNRDFYNFRIRVKKRDLSQKVIKLRIEADSWFFRLLAPHIDITYDTEKLRMVRYEGPSNLLSSQGEKMKVDITYRYGNKSQAEKWVSEGGV